MNVTTLTRHPSAEMLLSYSAGSALPSHALCVATHLEYCPGCRAAHQRNNAIGGKLIEELPETDVSTELKSRVLEMLDKERGESKKEPTVPVSTGVPRPLRGLIPNGFSNLKWQIISASARSCELMRDDDGPRISLLKLKPGGRVARHTHLGDEYTVILSGNFSDEDGLYQPGDFLLRDGSEEHSPVATRDAECICLTVQDAPLQFTGWLFRLLNPLLRRQQLAS